MVRCCGGVGGCLRVRLLAAPYFSAETTDSATHHPKQVSTLTFPRRMSHKASQNSETVHLHRQYHHHRPSLPPLRSDLTPQRAAPS